MLEKLPCRFNKGIAITGTGGKLATELIGGIFVNEIIAQATSTGILYPEARTVIEIGGEDSKLDTSGKRSCQTVIQDLLILK